MATVGEFCTYCIGTTETGHMKGCVHNPPNSPNDGVEPEAASGEVKRTDVDGQPALVDSRVPDGTVGGAMGEAGAAAAQKLIEVDGAVATLRSAPPLLVLRPPTLDEAMAAKKKRQHELEVATTVAEDANKRKKEAQGALGVAIEEVFAAYERERAPQLPGLEQPNAAQADPAKPAPPPPHALEVREENGIIGVVCTGCGNEVFGLENVGLNPTEDQLFSWLGIHLMHLGITEGEPVQHALEWQNENAVLSAVCTGCGTVVWSGDAVADAEVSYDREARLRELLDEHVAAMERGEG